MIPTPDYPFNTEYPIAATINWIKVNTQKYRTKSRIFVCRCRTDALRLASSVPPIIEITRMVIPGIAKFMLHGPVSLSIARFQDSILFYSKSGQMSTKICLQNEKGFQKHWLVVLFNIYYIVLLSHIHFYYNSKKSSY